LLDYTQDGIAQILAVLRGKTDLDAIDIISHGSPGSITLGSGVLNNGNLDDYAAQLAQIGRHLGEDADIMLYGCEVAQGKAGQTFIERLAQITGATVAASARLVGAADLGGDWLLEAQTGAMHSSALELTYPGVLAIVNGTTGNDTLTGTTGDDTLTGGLGNDALDGGSGTDIAVFSGNQSGYEFSLNATNGQITVRDTDATNGDEGTDTLTGIETLRFANGDIQNSTKPDEFKVNTYTANHQRTPSITALDDGGFVVTWSDSGRIYAQRYHADGTAAGAEFKVNTYTTNGQYAPSITALNDGGFVVTWESYGQDGSYGGIYAQRYNANGTAVLSDSITGSAGDDHLTISAANTTSVQLLGMAGNDVLQRGGGASYLLDGGDGTDTASYSSASNSVTVNLYTKNGSVATGWGDYLTGIENVVGSAYADTLTGDANANKITGGAGNDVIDGGAGADSLIGGLGDDTYTVDNTGDTVTENTNEGIDLVKSKVTYTLPANVENLTLTGTAAINGTGNGLANTLTGNGAVNILTGGAGNDAINGGAGADSLIGGLGDDTYTVDNTGDTVTENASEGTDKVNSSVTYTLPLNVENLTLTGTATIDGIGNGLANTLTGNAAVNILTGGAGNDAINGGAGADSMIGGLGNDTYTVDNIGDTVTENASEGTDLVKSKVTYMLPANVENLTLTGTAAINGTGTDLANTLTGNTASNQLNGSAGNDVLDGGAGTDTLTGGAGKDKFNFTTTGNIDTITDFVVIDDTIQLENAVYTALTITGTLAADQFIIGAAAVDANDYVIYDSTTGALLYDADGSGATAAVQIAIVTTGLSMTNADIVVI
jgi:Ca2+-binding RTX toxin-like protein